MINKDLDEILREKLEMYSESVGDDVWTGIESRLNKAHRAKIIRRVSLSAIAVPASLLVGLFVFRDSQDGSSRISEPSSIAEVVDQTKTDVAGESSVKDVISMTEQIKNLRSSVAMLEVEKSKESKEQLKGTIGQTDNNEEAVVAVVEEVVEKIAVKEQTPVKETETVEPPVQEQPEISIDRYIAQLDKEEAQSKHSRHTSSLAITSNISSVASEGSFIADFGPAHSSSQTGEVAGSGIIEPVSETPKYFVPISLGLQFKTSLYKNLYLGAGVRYSYLVTQYDALVDKELFKGTYNQLHYVGIPVSLYYNFVNTDRLGVYASLGGAIDKCVSSRYVYGSHVSHEKVKGLQYSVNIGIGVEYWFVKRFGIYFDPSISYYFDNSQPLCIRTSQPLQINAELGFRFKI